MQAGVVGEVCKADEDGDKRDGPAPVERGCLVAFRVPEDAAYCCHDDHLIEVEPALYEHRVQGLHYEFVIQAAYCSEDGSSCYAPHPFVLFEVYVFLLAGPAHHVDGEDGKKDSHPLISVEPFSEKEHGSYQDKYRSGGVDRADDCERKVLETEIATDP